MIPESTLNKPGDDLDPTIRSFIRLTNEAYASHRNGATPSHVEARAVAEKVREPWVKGGPVMVRTEDFAVPSQHGPVRIRLYDPNPETPKPALIYVHGGGWVMFSLDTHDRIMREYAARAGICVIGIDYSLSPEARFPVALEEIIAVVRHVRNNAADYGIDGRHLALGGDSAGANLSLATALSLRDAGEGATLAGLVLNYGAFDTQLVAEDTARFGGDAYMLTTEEMNQFWVHYLTSPDDARNPLATPLNADLQNLPPVFLCVPQCDVLHSQSLILCDRLKAAQVSAEAIVYAGASHSFLEAVSISPLADRAFDDAAAWLRGKLL